MTINRILVAFDFSSDSGSALASALALARTFAASVHVLHVVDNPLAAGAWSSEIYTAQIAGLQINLMHDAQKQLRQALRAIDHAGIRLTSDIRVGHPGQTIVECARDRESDLIVVGSHSRTGLPLLVVGSVGEYVVRHADCPVLVSRPIARDARAAQAAS